MTVKASALLVTLHPFFQRQESPTHPEWKDSTAVTTFCLLSSHRLQEITPEKEFYTQKSTEAAEKAQVYKAPVLQ